MRPWRLRGGDESGQAMMIVGAALALLALVPLAIVTSTVDQLPLTAHDLDYNAAFEATQAGLNDYLEHLGEDQNYVVYSASNPPPDGNQAFTGWVPVPGPPTNPPEWFRYTPDLSKAAQTGVVRLAVSGKAGSVTSVVRTIDVGLRRRGFLDFIYFTDYETADPVTYANPQTAQQSCQYHQYDPNPTTGGYGPDPTSCRLIYFISADTLRGPVHSNDGLYVCGNPTFTASVTSSDPNPPRWVSGSGCTSTPSFANPGDPAYEGVLSLPPTDSGLKSEVTIGQAGAGCLYTGPTTIAFHAGGTMDVTSPETRKTNPGCGPGTGLAEPPNGLIYVQNVPTASADPNYSASCQAANNPIAGHSCWNGDAIVANAGSGGGVKGQLTVASEDDVVVDGNLTYSSGLTGTDVLGLIADNFIEVNHPVANGANVATCGSGGTPPNCDLQNPLIDAAVLSLGHSFEVDNYASGAPLGTLAVNGSIAQRFRGPVGTQSSGRIVSGYAKSYTYDPRLHYLSPPYYLSPVASAWYPLSYAETQAAYH